MTRTDDATPRSPWSWIPTLYLAEGLPYVVVMTVSVIMYKGLGISNTDIALYTSWLYLPWVIKPLWSPVVDILKTRRLWIWTAQILIGAGLAGVALSLQAPKFFQYSLAFLWLLAFSSATHDIAADGFYMLATTGKQQAFFVGIRSTFYRIATIVGQGLIVILAGWIQAHTGPAPIGIEVQTGPEIAQVESIETRRDTTPAGLSIQAEPRSLHIEVRPRAPGEAQVFLASIREQNLALGFHPAETSVEPSSGRISRALSTVSRTLSVPFRRLGETLGPWLHDRFGETRTETTTAGSMGTVEVRLSHPPQQEMVVTVSSRSGDKSISVVEGSRLLFTAQNWNSPAVVVFQTDPGLRNASSAAFEIRAGNIRLSWIIAFSTLGALFLLFAVYHRFVLPRPTSDQPGETRTALRFIREFLSTFADYFRKPGIPVLLLFLFFYRFAEAQLVKMVAPFLLDPRGQGGLGLTTGEVGFVYGTIGIVALTCGGLLGGVLASRRGLKFWLWPMVLSIHLPDAVFVYLAHAQPESLWIVNLCVAFEQFGYGFGFTAYMLYMIYIARGKHQTAHYAICTGFMALGMMLPGMWSGWLQELIGYRHFFIWVMLATIPGFIVTALIPLDREFGRKD